MLWLMALMGAAAVALPAVAASETGPAAPIEAENIPGSGYYSEGHAWHNGTVTIEAGGSVAISNPTAVPHGIVWSGPAPSCSSGVPVGTSGTHWSGTCSFSQPGTYSFYCTVHGPAMSGTVTVTAPAAPAPGGNGGNGTNGGSTTAPAPAIAPGAGAAGPGHAASPSPLAGDAGTAVRVASRQRGDAVRGSVAVAPAGAGWRLEVRLLSAKAALARAGRPRQVLVGRLVRPHLRAEILRFGVALDAAARRALRAHGHLAISVEIVLAPAGGAAVTQGRAVTLRV